MQKYDTDAMRDKLDFLASTTSMDRTDLDILMEAVCEETAAKGMALNPDVFVTFISTIYAKGYAVTKSPLLGDMTDSYKFPAGSNKSKDDEFMLVCSRMNSSKKEPKSPLKIEKRESSDSDFEVDIDREQQAVYDVIIDQNRKNSKTGLEDSLLLRQAQQAMKRTRRLSYEEYINGGGSFDHLLLSADSSFYRELFLKLEVFKPTDDLGEFFSCKAGPSSLIYLDSKHN